MSTQLHIWRLYQKINTRWISAHEWARLQHGNLDTLTCKSLIKNNTCFKSLFCLRWLHCVPWNSKQITSDCCSSDFQVSLWNYRWSLGLKNVLMDITIKIVMINKNKKNCDESCWRIIKFIFLLKTLYGALLINCPTHTAHIELSSMLILQKDFQELGCCLIVTVIVFPCTFLLPHISILEILGL